jgi:hypothetical protein
MAGPAPDTVITPVTEVARAPPSPALSRVISVTASPVTRRVFQSTVLVVEENTTFGMSRQRRANSIAAGATPGCRSANENSSPPTVYAHTAPGPSHRPAPANINNLVEDNRQVLRERRYARTPQFPRPGPLAKLSAPFGSVGGVEGAIQFDELLLLLRRMHPTTIEWRIAGVIPSIVDVGATRG